MTSAFFRASGVRRDRPRPRRSCRWVLRGGLPGQRSGSAETTCLLGPWLRYVREVLKTDSAVVVREAVDLTAERGEITALLGAGGVLGTAW